MKILSLLLTTIIFSSCINFGTGNNLGSKKNAKEFDFSLSSRKISISGPISVYITNGYDVKAKVLNEEVLANFVTSVKDGIMYIETKPNFFPYGSGNFDLIIGVGAIDSLKIETDRRFFAKEEIRTSKIELILSGSTWGEMTAKIDDLTIISNSPKTFKVRGQGRKLKVIASDLARVDVKSYVADEEVITQEAGSVVLK